MFTMSQEYWWKDIKQAIKEFVQSCIHCIISRNGERIPRPMSAALHGERPKEVVYADLLCTGAAGNEDLKYSLVIKDYISSCTWLRPCERADSDVPTAALGKWITLFGEMSWLVTDQGLHCTTLLMRNLTDSLHIKHQLTTAYYPSANGTVERVCKEVLCIAQALLSEWKLSTKQWPSVIYVIQTVINGSPVERFQKDEKHNKRCPVEVHTGFKPQLFRARRTPLRK